jgi:methyltransferase
MLYLALVAVAALLALLERLYAHRNERRLRRQGAVEVAPWVFRLMVPVYILIFPAAVGEHLLLHRRPPAVLVAVALLLFSASKLLKGWAVLHLRQAWTMTVLIPPRLRVVASGPYRFLRHPNYVAVMGEVAALPLAGGAWLTALGGAALFGVLLVFRVRSEETALLARPEYAAAMGGRRRFLPRRRDAPRSGVS